MGFVWNHDKIQPIQSKIHPTAFGSSANEKKRLIAWMSHLDETG